MSRVILDTDVVSEHGGQYPIPTSRLGCAQQPEQLYLATTVIAELAVGIERMPPGRRRASFQRWLDAHHRGFRHSHPDVRCRGCLIYGKMVAEAVARGRPPTVGDAQIAAVARRHRMAVASRDIRAFETLDVAIIDPWTGA